MIRIRNVHKTFGTFHAVRGVSFEVPTGQCVGLLGPNGAGKSTTIRMVTGFFPPNSGGIEVDGYDTVHASMEARRRIGYLPEATPLYPEMRVRDYLSHRAALFGVGRSNRNRRVEAAVEQCWLKEVRHRRIGHLSKGYKQRVGLASALVHDPPVLVLDEPTSGLDPSQIRETRSLIRELAANRTVLVSSHILPEVEKTCDRVVIMARGRVRADGPPRLLVEQAGRAGGGSGTPHTAEVHAPDAASQARVLATVRGVPGVEHAEAEAPDKSGWIRVTARLHADQIDIREPLLTALTAAGLRVREISRTSPTLEQVFIGLIEDEEPATESAGGEVRP